MNKSGDKHMNIFQAYTQQSDHPIENNLSRGLAIILQESPALFMRLIAKLNTQVQCIPFPQGEYTIDFQRNAVSFDQAQTLVGVTLTAKDFEEAEDKSKVAKDKKYITDISIFYDDVLIFIEVKRTGENCENQLREQLAKYLESIQMEEPITTPPIIYLTWTDIVKMLQENLRSYDGGASRLEVDYLEYLIRNFHSWAPVEHLNKLKPLLDDPRIQQRLERLKEEYAQNEEINLISTRKSIPLDFPFATECNLGYCSDLLLPDGSRKACITVSFWIADTCGQFWKFRNQANLDFFRKRIQSVPVAINEKNIIIDVFLYPYVKCSHFQRGVHWIYSEEVKQDNDALSIENWIKYAEEFTGRRKKIKNTGDWQQLPERIAERCSNIFSEDNRQWFIKEFYRIFETKSYADISFGIEVKAIIPFSIAQEADKDKSEFTKILGDYLKAIKDRIVK